MSATRDLIAAALTAADELEGQWQRKGWKPLKQAETDLREACARAMVETVSAVEVPMLEEEDLLLAHQGGEAKGYARGLAAGGKDAERYRWLRRKFAIIATDRGAVFHALNLPLATYVAPDAAIELDAAIDAALRGEVRP